MIAKYFELLRFMGVIGGAFFCNLFAGHDPILMLHYFMPCLVLSLSGLTGIEGFFFSNQTAASLGREPNNPYQRQSAMNSLAVGITGIIVWLAGWGVYAEATVMIATLLFITLSACVHTWETIKLGNRNLKNMMRGIWTIALLAFCLPVLTHALTYHNVLV